VAPITARAPGVSRAAPIPWIARPATRPWTVGARAQPMGQREDRDPDQKDPPAAEPIAGRTADQNEGAQR